MSKQEIEALNDLLAKTYQSINCTEHNVRVAAKLESEVEELTKKAKAIRRSDSSTR
jgi:hypothetical protein